MRNRVALFALVALAALAVSCGRGGTSLTAGTSGRRVADFDVDGRLVAYEWLPAQLMSVEGHVVVLDTATGTETIVETGFGGYVALSGNRLLRANTRTDPDDVESDVVLKDLATGEEKTLARARVFALDIAGPYAVWAVQYGVGSDIMLANLDTGETKRISEGGEEGTTQNRFPAAGDAVIAWEARDLAEDSSKIVAYDVASGEKKTIEIADEAPLISVSGRRVAYAVKTGGGRDIRVYDLETGADTLVASCTRFTAGPSIEGDAIAWCEHITKERFKPVNGQPLIREDEFDDVYVHNLKSGKKKRIAEALLTSGSQVILSGGSVYLPVYREFPAPRASNMLTSVDLRRL